jgi:hypothetical protein
VYRVYYWKKNKMKKILALGLCLILVCSCQSNVLKDYKEDTTIKIDTLSIEKIKIDTH